MEQALCLTKQLLSWDNAASISTRSSTQCICQGGLYAWLLTDSLHAAADFYSQFNHCWASSWAMAVELTALKMYWAHSLTGMHDLAMRQVIDGADALVSITSSPTKVQASAVTTIPSACTTGYV